ncbi:Leucine Rich Repeat domain protein [Aspergillus lucknowensis]|uniref:F-box domain-containing protein n=1 Tax=Aspergillus lucknowensis TaxID=176173 RepID=A0ABR4LK50_9EURO
MGSRGEATLLQRQGQNLYGQGSWEAAVNAFTEALKCPEADIVSVLDNRAATYTKLLRYDQALKDARQMIKRDKQDERGYLRCAKALLLDGKPEKALEVYAYALKSLPKDNLRRQTVEQMHQKLQDKLLSKCYDPFSVFPYEIARMVVDHFDFRQIVAILRVSKGWDRFLSSMRELWMRLDFSGARSKIHWSSVLAYIRRSKAMLTEAIVTNLTKASIRKVLEYISRCPNLQHLEILCPFGSEAIYELFKTSKQLKVLLISAETSIPQSTLTKLLSTLPKLERIEIHRATKSRESDTRWPSSLPNLQSITLGTTESGVLENYVPALYIPRITDPPTNPFPISNLTELRLHSNPQIFVPYPPSFNPADLPKLQKLDISGLYVGGEFGLPASLQFLRIRGGAAIEALPFTTQEQRPLHLPNLETLIFSDVPWVTYVTLLAFIADSKSPLGVLHVDSCFRVTAATLVAILREHASQLRTLNIAHIMGIDDTIVYVLIERLEALKVLNLSFTDITGVTIKMLVDARAAGNKANVECVYVKGCEGISSDAIEYGRSRGLTIVT